MSHVGDSGQRMLLEFRAREAWSQRDYARSHELAEEWAAICLRDGDDESWWNASHLRAESLRKQGRMNESRRVADELSTHRLTAESPPLRARVLTLQAFALQGSGDLTAAVKAATSAVSAVSGIPDHNGIAIEAQNALIAALAESGLLDQAWRASLRLGELLEAEQDGQTTGMGYWAIGNVAFLLKRNQDGADYHQRAARTLSPTNDLDLWARFNHGSAQMRLAAGLMGPETLESIERAEMAMSIAGGTPRDRLELSLTRAHWFVLSGQPDAAVESLTGILRQKDMLASHTAAQAHFLMGQALLGRDRRSDTEAIDQLTLSEDLFLRSGAEDKASTARGLIRSLGAS